MRGASGLVASIASILLLICCGGCDEKPGEAPAPPPPPVNVVVPVVQSVQDYDEFTGSVKPIETVDVRSKVTGYLQQIGFQDGAEVKKGDLLFQIDPRPFQADLDRSKGELDRSKAQLVYGNAQVERLSEVTKTGAASQKELDQAVALRDQAQAAISANNAAIASDQLNLDYSRITAPIDGRIGRPLVTIGNLISSNTELTSIVSMNPIYVDFYVDEQRFLWYRDQAVKAGQSTIHIKKVNMPVYVALANESNYPHKGVIDFVNNEVDRTTGTILVRGLFDNADRSLVPGLFVRVRVPRGEAANVLLIPDRAIMRDQDRKYVYVVNDQGIVEYRSVETGAQVGDMRAVTKGIKAGEKIIVDGIQRARPGLPVTPKMLEPATQPATQSFSLSRYSGRGLG